MAPIKDSLIDLERHRILLQDKILELRKALQHWQTWDAEYEGLKEEVTAAGPSPDELERIQTGFDGELVKQKEIGEIFGLTGQKSKEQIINVLERRIDYVTKNIETLRKQLQAHENKYAAASIISQPDARDEEGQPITEIVEELDEDDNVISFKLNRPGEGVPHIEEALKKAGIKDLVKDLAAVKKDVKEDTGRASTQAQTSQQEDPSKVQPKEKHVAEPKRKDESAPKKQIKKKVSFAETHDVEEVEPAVSRMAARVENIMDAAKGQDAILKEKPVIPANESPEDAALREEMLRYSMGEIGAVVAELEIEENQTSDYEEEDYEFEYSDADLDEDEDYDHEDKYGRFTGSIVTDDYRQRMLELEKKLGVKSRFTAKMEAEEAQEARVQEVEDESSDDEGIGRIVVTRGEDAPSSVQPSTEQTEVKPKKKGVRFAESLDIAPEKPPKTTDAAPTTEKEAIVEPLSDIVVERSGSLKPTEAPSNRKPSRFKKTMNSAPEAGALPKGPLDVSPVFLDQDRPTAPTGPEGKTIADQLVERETTPGVVPADDDLTDITLHQEIAAEHHRLRRKFIQREGGFLEEKESPTQPVDETEGGVGKRPSRFKAARLSKQ
ncbi:unnamed protein product [Clonostachys rosea f. rosea IK726]|jgi:unconventional prefoldin RPB5 interactor 1|uniref:DUF3835 domain-containing protein n=2 Tax=Bionectria ochroleuca TaxID=29856 RepID=A0A0B7JXY0_BIOOC|nr:unnamed protein product [Clonostachys rosea f. rosea IK726]